MYIKIKKKTYIHLIFIVIILLDFYIFTEVIIANIKNGIIGKMKSYLQPKYIIYI